LWYLNEAAGRPFDSTVNGARMIGSGVFDRHPKLQVLIVHMGGELASILVASNSLGTSTTMGFATRRSAGLTRTSCRHQIISRPTSWSTAWGSTPSDCAPRLKCAVWTKWCSAPISPVPYGIEEHVRIVEDVLPSPAERQQVFWKTSNRVFRLGLFDTDLITH
jgi:hypothetical protein